MTKISIIGSVKDIPAETWDALAKSGNSHIQPFALHGFLAALEESGCIGPTTGWNLNCVVAKVNDQIVGLAPCFVKSHSQGEYVFDHGWAEAFQRAGGQYYPKLQLSFPFTPVAGPHLLAESKEIKLVLATALESLCETNSLSSVHATFVDAIDAEIFVGRNWLCREDTQFHWHNQNYQSFDEFLATLSSSRRKNLRKERLATHNLGITHEWRIGDEITSKHWDTFFEFYMDTANRKWGRPYLNRKFFDLLHQKMPKHLLLILAKRDSKYIAGAMNVIGGETLYGRYWGCSENHPFLHFETSYYQAIDYAIANHLRTVEAGAQGEHKLARGYLPITTTSFHYIAHPGLRRAIADYLVSERKAVEIDQQEFIKQSPFRHEV